MKSIRILLTCFFAAFASVALVRAEASADKKAEDKGCCAIEKKEEKKGCCDAGTASDKKACCDKKEEKKDEKKS